MFTCDTVIAIARNEVGYFEKKSNKELDSKTGNKGNGNYTKYARDLDNVPNFYNGKKNGFPWCDVFVDWCFYKAFGADKAKEILFQPDKSLGAGCLYSYRYFKNSGHYGSEPKRGAQIFYGTDENKINHTGIVYDFDDVYVYTIEGNVSDCVDYRKHKRNAKDIIGYGYPKYDNVSVDVESIVSEVINGKWGNGNERKNKLNSAGYDYETIQNRVNEYYNAANKCVEIVKNANLDFETFNKIFNSVI